MPAKKKTSQKNTKREETKMTEAKPEMTPPAEDGHMTTGKDSRPMASAHETDETLLSGAEESMPQAEPPEDEVLAATGAYGASTWHNNKKITALWSKNENRNSWIAVSGLGWKKLTNNSDSSIIALTMLAGHAKQIGGQVNLKEDSGQIKEMYVW